eukprot:Tbor_TRINITY_DN10073_c0_g1::TRINITY_DN10073_c0_g1_i1::g.12320::m.12320
MMRRIVPSLFVNPRAEIITPPHWNLVSSLSTVVTGCVTNSTFHQRRTITLSGRVTNEDRRWWLVHLECAPDVTPTTFVGWLDCCSEHCAKKLIERNIWTIEQVAGLTSDQVDELRFGEGCIKMDIIWEHARTILAPLRQRETSGGVESELQDKVLQLRKKRELEKQRQELLRNRIDTAESRQQAMMKLREAIQAKKEMLMNKQREKMKANQKQNDASDEEGDDMPTADVSVKNIVDDLTSKLKEDTFNPPKR